MRQDADNPYVVGGRRVSVENLFFSFNPLFVFGLLNIR